MSVTTISRLKKLYCVHCRATTFHRASDTGHVCGVCGTDKLVRL